MPFHKCDEMLISQGLNIECSYHFYAEHSDSVDRALAWISKGYKFKTHRRQSHCVVYSSKTLYLLLSNGSSQEDRT